MFCNLKGKEQNHLSTSCPSFSIQLGLAGYRYSDLFFLTFINFKLSQLKYRQVLYAFTKNKQLFSLLVG